MANRLQRNPGDFATTTLKGGISSVPDHVVQTGEQTAAALQSVGTQLSSRIGKMADRAAAREGEAAGLEAGAGAGRKFIEKDAAEARGQARAAKKPGTTEKVPVAAQGAPALNSAPLQLRRDGTIRGEAFDAAAVKAYGWRMQTGLTTALAEAYDTNKDNPDGYEKAIGDIRQTFAGEELLREGPLREAFEQIYSEKVSIGRLSVQSRHEAKLKAAAAAATNEGIEAARKSLERDAYTVGGNPAGDAAIEQQLGRLNAQIDASVADGTYSAAQGVKLKKSMKNTVTNARTQGTFDALPNPEAQADFALGVMDDYASGKGPYAELSLDEARSLSNELYSAAVRNSSALTSEQKKARADLALKMEDDLTSIAATGQGLEDAELTAERVETMLGGGALEEWRQAQDLAQRGWQSTAGMELETPQEITARIAALKPAAGDENFAERQKIYEAASKKATAVLEERETDPLGQASRAKMIKLAPIDTSNAEALSVSLANRRIAADAVAREYGIAPVLFRPEERKGLVQAFTAYPDLLPGFAATAVAQFGEELAPIALAEISEAGPELAHVAGVAMATGDNSAALDVAETLKARAEKRSVKLPGEGVLADAAGMVAGAAFSAAPQLRNAALGTANLLLEHEAARLGFDPSDVRKAGSQANETYARVIEQALGARMIGGQKWGGFTEINGRQVIAPTFMPAGDVAGVLSGLSDAVLQRLPPIESGNGVPISASQIRGGQLVAVGDGQYRVALGDPEGFDPQWLVTPAGDYWVLDLDRVRSFAAERGRPQIVIGGMGAVQFPGGGQ